jgi:hypothetical protein
MGKIAAFLFAVLVVCLVACVGETETDEEQASAEVTDTVELPTNTSVPPTNTPEPLTMNSMDETSSECVLATSAEEVIGSWQAGGGRFILFDDEGLFSQARFLSQLDDQPYAVSSYRFDGSELLIVEVSVSGVPSCGNAAALYEVELLENGNIQLTAVQDNCVNRADETSGVYESVD